MKDFTLKDLKQGMVLHTRDNQKYTMINDKEFYVEDISNLGSTYEYNKDLTSKENNLEDILKITFGNETVYERPKRNGTIYEQALEDLYYVILVGYPKEMIGKTTQTKRLLDFIEQAEKKEKLLKLYIELGYIFEMLDNNFGYGIFEDYEIKNICEKIRELNIYFEVEE